MLKILIVDDARTEQFALKGLLERHGYQTLLATSGEAALAMAQEIPPDLILMDVVMPGMNGFQATRRLARDARTRDIPVIIVSSKAQESDRQWALRQGARDYIVKPVVEEDLLRKVRALIGEPAPG